MSKAEELRDIQSELLELLDQAERIIAGTSAHNRAKSYWLAHAKMALTKDHGFMAGSMVDLDDTIAEIEQEEEDEEFA